MQNLLFLAPGAEENIHFKVSDFTQNTLQQKWYSFITLCFLYLYFMYSGCHFKRRRIKVLLREYHNGCFSVWLVYATHSPTPVLPLSVVAFLQPLFETEGIVFPHQETETHGKRDFDFDLLPVL